MNRLPMDTPAHTARNAATERLERIPEFAGVSFDKSVVDVEGLPFVTGPEIAFAGRSNAGKSSSINKFDFTIKNEEELNQSLNF